MARQILTPEEEAFLGDMRALLLTRPRQASLAAKQARRVLNFTHDILSGASGLEALTGSLCRTGAVCDWLGVSRQAVFKAAAEGRILGFRTLDKRWVYPMWQFDSPEVYELCVAVLPSVIDVLASRGVVGLEAAVWFMGTNSSLNGRCPMEALREAALSSDPAATSLVAAELVAAAKKACAPNKPRPLPRLNEILAP